VLILDVSNKFLLFGAKFSRATKPDQASLLTLSQEQVELPNLINTNKAMATINEL
jgi:hypothetical protein